MGGDNPDITAGQSPAVPVPPGGELVRHDLVIHIEF